jgi:hypothetical protein
MVAMYKPDIDFGSSFAENPPDFEQLKYRVDAALKTIQFLDQDVEVDLPEQAKARAVFTQALPEDTQELHNPGVVLHLKLMLSEYDKQVIASAAQLRTYITNKLLEDSGSTDPRVRLKSLELLGKISDVGLFTDKSEVTIRHRPTEELERLLQEKLARVLEVDPEEEKARRPLPQPPAEPEPVIEDTPVPNERAARKRARRTT